MSESEKIAERAKSIVRSVSCVYDSPDEVLEECLRKIVDALGAERGFIMIYDSAFDELSVFVTYNLDIDTMFISAEISQTVVNRVYENRVSVLTTDASLDPRFSDKSSVVISGLRSLLCVPIKDDKGLYGIVYVDNRTIVGAYKKLDLAFLEYCGLALADLMAKVMPNLVPKP